jgi:glyoxylase I family protein
MAIELRGSAPLFEVFDMPAAFAFYPGVLGFDVVNTNKDKDTDPADLDWAWLRLNDVDAAYEHLSAHGVDAKPPKVAPYGMKQLYVRDPDGYTLCFQWPEKR